MLVQRLVARPILDVEAEHAEAPVWDAADGRLLFVDIPRGRVIQWRPGAPLDEVVERFIGRDVSDVHPTTTGDLVLGVREGVAIWGDGAVIPVFQPLTDRPALRMNDGNVDPAGRYFLGSMAYDHTEHAASLYRFDPWTGIGAEVLSDVTISNGIDWAPDGRTAYYIDSTLRRIDSFEYDVETGSLGARAPWVDLRDTAGLPDGLTVDADGNVWVAIFGGGQVRCYRPDGTCIAVVTLPTAQLVTACCFGGPDFTDLYITTSTEGLEGPDLAVQSGAGLLWHVSTSVAGKAAYPFPWRHKEIPHV